MVGDAAAAGMVSAMLQSVLEESSSSEVVPAEALALPEAVAAAVAAGNSPQPCGRVAGTLVIAAALSRSVMTAWP